MLIQSPLSIHYPIQVTGLLVQSGSEVKRFDQLFSYTYKSKVVEGPEKTEVEKSFPAEFESETEGTVKEWQIKKGDVIARPGIPLIEIEEPCTHDVQFGGLCAICGKDMTEVNYSTTRTDASRAPVNMTHLRTNLMVSRDQASRTAENQKRRLLGLKKLSLVVDLDQTIIHATVDPTVADWQRDATNPNHNAVKDVQSFQLQDEGPGNRICSYYIKMRPGLREFLEEISQLYELHIYTMGTRSYALNVAKIVDPDQKFFGDRILSRDESGSLISKKLDRLFPVDTDMVVIIDDRGDVWNYSYNLVRVTPYDFFVGIGDINSSFLPKRQDLVKSTKPPEEDGAEIADDENVKESANGGASESPATAPSIDEQLVAMVGGGDASVLEERGHQQQEEIAAQLEDRPLLKKQELLDKIDEANKENAEVNGTQETAEAQERHNLLKDDDRELEQLQKNLESIHTEFYAEYEKTHAGAVGGRLAELRGERKRASDELIAPVPDIKLILSNAKVQTLRGVVICFTGVIPQATPHDTSDIGMWARSFGAIVSPHLTKSTTHVIAHQERRTSKVRQAAKHPHIKIVTTNWLFECFVYWKHVDEEPFKIEVEADDRPDELLPPEFTEGLSSDGGYPHDDMNGLGEDDGSQTTNGDFDDEDDDEPPISPIQDAMPVNQGDWDDIEDELDGYLDSDDSEDDFSETGDGDTSENDSDASTSSKKSSRKRKRTGSDDGAEKEPNGVNGPPTSNLQKRKKRAMERTSSLTHVSNADQSSGLPSPDETGPEEEEGAVGIKKPVEAVDEAEEDDDENGEDLEAAMRAAFEDGDDNE